LLYTSSTLHATLNVECSIGTICPSLEKPALDAVHSDLLNGFSRVQIIDGVEHRMLSYAKYLTKLQFPDASRLPLLCRSAHFNRLSKKCSIYSDSINPNGYLQYKPNSNVLYMEKLCISDVILPLSCDEAFRRIPQHILLGHASEILTSTSEEECIRECILAKVNRGFECQSLLHYPDQPVSNCILNIHSRRTRPEFFIPELEKKVDYVQVPECAKRLVEGRIEPKNFSKRGVRLPSGVGIVESEWSEWTACDLQTSTRRRDRLCSDCVERIQIQPCFSNESFNLLLNTFIDEHDEGIVRFAVINFSSPNN
uniref:Apple domain-containing protein n=1 Tax=Angiostrongylus costaricensis TaxID=334426 RepID=A0A158PKV1_ANGCS